MPREMANHRLRELDVIGRAHGDGVLVRSGLESQLQLIDQRVIDDGGNAEELADGRLCAQLGHDAWYWMYFEPMKTQVEKAEPVGGNLADDLADVYRDVATGLRAWDSTDDSPLDEVVFQWLRGGFEIHWGAHAVDALGILHRVVTDRITRDPEPGA